MWPTRRRLISQSRTNILGNIMGQQHGTVRANGGSRVASRMEAMTLCLLCERAVNSIFLALEQPVLLPGILGIDYIHVVVTTISYCGLGNL